MAWPAPGDLWREPVTGLTLVFVPAGEFWMGSSKTPGERNFDQDACNDELPPRRVELAQGFWMAQHPVTNEVYGRFLEQGQQPEPAYWRNPRFKGPDKPVVGVSFHDAVAFCRWATQAGPLTDNLVFDLPREDEWEYAAGAAGGDGTARRYPWGDEPPTPDRAVFVGVVTPDGPAPVGGRPAGATPLGIHDMAGNVWEWCLDEYRATSFTTAGARVVRGGSWLHFAWCLRPSARDWRPTVQDWPAPPGWPEALLRNVGFRVVVRRAHAPAPRVVS